MDRNSFRTNFVDFLPDPATGHRMARGHVSTCRLGHPVSLCLLPHKSTCLYISRKTFFPRVELLVKSKKISL